MDKIRTPVVDPRAGKIKTGHLWALTRYERGWNGGDHTAVVFIYAPGRHGRDAMEILSGFDGILQIVGYSSYDPLVEPRSEGGALLTLARCWAHVRHKLNEIRP